MFLTKLISISVAVVLTLPAVSSKQCIYKFDSHQNNYVECRNVKRLNELSQDIKSDWNFVKIVNYINDTFTAAG